MCGEVPFGQSVPLAKQYRFPEEILDTLTISSLQNTLGHAQYAKLSLLPHASKRLLMCIFSAHRGLSQPDTGHRPSCPCTVDSWKLTVNTYRRILLLLSSHDIVSMYILRVTQPKKTQDVKHWRKKITLLSSFHHPFTANIPLANVANLTDRWRLALMYTLFKKGHLSQTLSWPNSYDFWTKAVRTCMCIII